MTTVPMLIVVESCDGCGPAVRAIEVWVKPPTDTTPQRVLTFCGHCSRLQTPALQHQGFHPLENEDATR